MKNILRQVVPCLSNLKRIAPLILSVSLLHSSAFAECGPYGEGQCGECGPHWSDWYAEQCPTNSNIASVTPSWYGCNETGQSVPQPTVVAPTFAGGKKARVAWYDCSTNLNYQYGGITYSVGAVQWDPPLPGTFGVQHVPYFSSSAYVDVASSDTNLCASPGRWYIGSCTWRVVNANLSLQMFGFEYVPQWASSLANFGLGWFGLGTLSPVNGFETTVYREFCCDSETPASMSSQKSEVNTGQQTLSVTIGTSFFSGLMEHIMNALSATENAGGSGLSSFINDLLPTINFASVSALGSDSSKTINYYYESCTCPDSPVLGAWYGHIGGGFTVTLPTITVPASIMQAIDPSYSEMTIVVLAGSKRYDRVGADAMFSSLPQVSHTVTETKREDIYSQFSFSVNGVQQGGTVYWSMTNPTPPDDPEPGVYYATSTTSSTLCESRYYP